MEIPTYSVSQDFCKNKAVNCVFFAPKPVPLERCVQKGPIALLSRVGDTSVSYYSLTNVSDEQKMVIIGKPEFGVFVNTFRLTMHHCILVFSTRTRFEKQSCIVADN